MRLWYCGERSSPSTRHTGAPWSGDSGERGTAWLGYALQEGIKHGLTDAREMLAHATPEVLVAQLPRDLTTQLIAGALKTGRLTPESVLEVAPPTVLAEHLEVERRVELPA